MKYRIVETVCEVRGEFRSSFEVQAKRFLFWRSIPGYGYAISTRTTLEEAQDLVRRLRSTHKVVHNVI